MQTSPDTPGLLYFAYGSNMSTLRLRSRAASACAVAMAWLPGHALRFHKRGRDGTAKCDACHTGHDHDRVYGVVFEIEAHEKPDLDTWEGLGSGYEEKQVTVTDAAGARYQAFTYYATHIDSRLRPYRWYKEHVLRGAREHELPVAYIAAIRSIEAIDDPARDNHGRELSIYHD
ncbi:MAG: gamma-glutamylcyclotransferase [Gammaproteobacteria bacterium]|jgi:gamma-glutamylcyclotransferase (GGCT)/AIG2-like uncharacterized protein YtfP